MTQPFHPSTMLRSPREKLAGYVHLPRLIDKVRCHARGILPEDYHPNLLAKNGNTFDGRFLLFTGIDPEDLRKVILSSPDDQTIGRWVEEKALSRSREEIRDWSDSNVKTLSVPTPERMALRARFYPEPAKILGLPLLGSVNPCDLIDFDEGRISREDLLKNHEDRIRKESRPPLPPFTRETALQKTRMAEDAWNSKNPERVALAYTVDSQWRNRSEFLTGRSEIVQFLTRKWIRELDYRLIKELWAFDGSRISVRFAYEWHDDSGNWFRSYGNENWEFAPNGLMSRRLASINDLPIREEERKFRWMKGPRPDDHPGLGDLGL
ncbi:MAG: DUF1348 family protein [Leptospirales bacterium]